MNTIINLIEKTYYFLWGDWIHLPLPGGTTINLPLLVLLLVPTGIFCTIRTRFLQIRMLPDMLRALLEKAETGHKGGSLSALQALIVSTATRVGMGNLVGIVAALSAGGAGALFWMWVTALLGSATAFIEATLAQLHKQPDPLYGGYRGGPAYYIHDWINSKRQKQGTPVSKKNLLSVLFALSGLICWCGISQVISNSVTSSFKNAFGIPPIYSCLFLVLLAAVIVLRKNASVRVLDLLVPIMAGIYIILTLFLIIVNFRQLPGVFARVFEEALGLRQAIAGGFGAVLMNGVKRGLFSNEAGMGSTPHAHARAVVKNPHCQGLAAMISVFIDTFIVLNLTVFSILTTNSLSSGKDGIMLTQYAFSTVFGSFGDIFIAVCLLFFAFSTILGWHFFGSINVKHLFGKKGMVPYSVLVAVFIVVGSMLKVDLVWTLADFFNGLMVIPNALALLALSGVVASICKKYSSEKSDN